MPSGNPNYIWIAARARNALRRRTLVSVLSGAAFVLALVGLVLIPRETTHVVRSAPPHGTRLVDTSSAADAVMLARASIRQADSALAAARRVIALQPPAQTRVADTLSPELRAERDSLSAMLKALGSAMASAQESPLPPAFHALATTPALASDPHVKTLLDSLDQVDKLRAPFGALGAGDPIYVSLTARLNELGRSIRDAAAEKRSELRARLAPLLTQPAPATAAVQVTHIDTAGFVSARDSATQQFARARALLDSLRNVNAKLDTAATVARQVANVGAPPLAMLGAALVIALATGFMIAFIGELRHPRVAHMREGEAVSNVRVLTVIRPSNVVERSRRQSDVEAPPLIDLTSESYRTLYLHLAATGATVPVVTLTGDVPLVVATVAANLAAVAAYEARTTLLVDGDPSTSAVTSVLRLKSEPGLSAVLAGHAELASSIVTTTIGRDRPLDVLPSGHGRLGTASQDAVGAVHDALARMQRRYDFIVMAVAPGYAQLSSETIIPAPDVILCAQVAVTEIADLRASVKGLRAAGRIVHGIVLWDDEPPRI